MDGLLDRGRMAVVTSYKTESDLDSICFFHLKAYRGEISDYTNSLMYFWSRELCDHFQLSHF